MGRVYLRKSKRNSDYWEVVDSGRVKSRHLKKTTAKAQANAIRRVKKKRKKRLNK